MGNSVDKRTIAQFVHDAVEMETAIYTLDKMKDNQLEYKEKVFIEKKKQVEQAIHEYDIKQEEANEAHQTLEIYKNKYEHEPPEEYQPHKKPQKQKTNSLLLILFDREHYEANWSLKIFALIMFGPLTWGVFVGIFMAIISSFGIKNTENPSYIAASITMLLLIILLIINKNKKAKKAEKERQDNIDRINMNRNLHILSLEQEYKAALETAKKYYSKVDKARNELQKTKKYCESIDDQIAVISKKRSMIRKNLDQLYGYGLVPPDYRDYDCLLILDQIFRNDLADTMREAIKIYEERVFRGSVIRGMDRIVSMLGQLSSDMSAISLKLDMINNNVAHMSSDLNRFNERIASEGAKNRAATEDLIRETQLGRYTNEKLLESNKRLEYYAEEYRMGRMPIR